MTMRAVANEKRERDTTSRCQFCSGARQVGRPVLDGTTESSSLWTWHAEMIGEFDWAAKNVVIVAF